MDPEPCFAGVELPGFGILILAPRGTALSTVPESPQGYWIDGYVEDLECLRVHLRLDRLNLFGNSHGGSVVLAYASAYPDRVHRVIAGNAPARVDQAFEDGVALARERFVAHVPDGAVRLDAAEAADAAADDADPAPAAQQRARRSVMGCWVGDLDEWDDPDRQPGHARPRCRQQSALPWWRRVAEQLVDLLAITETVDEIHAELGGWRLRGGRASYSRSQVRSSCSRRRCSASRLQGSSWSGLVRRACHNGASESAASRAEATSPRRI